MRALALLAMIAPEAGAAGKPTTIMTVLVSPPHRGPMPPPPQAPLPCLSLGRAPNQAAARADRRPRLGGHPDPEPLQPHAPYRPARLRRHRARAASRLPVDPTPHSRSDCLAGTQCACLRPGLTAVVAVRAQVLQPDPAQHPLGQVPRPHLGNPSACLQQLPPCATTLPPPCPLLE